MRSFGSGPERAAKPSLALLVCLLVSPGYAAAQSIGVGDPYEDYLRLLQISGEVPANSFSVRPLAVPTGDGWTLEGPWPADLAPGGEEAWAIEPMRARLRTWLNSGYPSIQNDGAVWQGKGLSSAMEFSVGARWKGLTLRLAPNLIFAQNSEFELAPVLVQDQSEFGYPWRRIDLPQRFGPDRLTRLDAGQSELSVRGLGVVFGATSRDQWWGPGIRSSIVMSNNAPGIPRAFAGTDGPRDIGIGTVEARWMWGRLSESGWFSLPTETDDRYMTGLVFAYNPSFLEGLSVGFTRAFFGAIPESGLPLSEYLLVLQGVTKDTQATSGNPTGDDDRDQLISLFARWALFESGFEVYGEWSRNDHAADLYDFLLEPEHSQGYTVGLQRALTLDGGQRLALRGELTHLEREATFRLRASPVYYSHYIVTQGYTQRGQVIGAGIGPGGNQQHLGLDFYDAWGRAGFMVQRRVADNDAYYNWAVTDGDDRYDNHDVSFDFGGSALVFRGDLEFEAGLIYTRQLNRNFFGDKVNNFNLHLGAHWRPGVR